MSTSRILRKVYPCESNNYQTNADEKTLEQTKTVASAKCKFCDENQDLDNCQFYSEISVDDRNVTSRKTDYTMIIITDCTTTQISPKRTN